MAATLEAASLVPEPLDAVLRWLQDNGIDYEVVTHSPTFTAAGEGVAYGAPPHRTAKTVALRSGERYALVVIPASERLDMRRARSLLKDAGARLAGERELAERFRAVEPGALPPFGGLVPFPELVDRRLLASSWVIANAGDHRHSVRVSPLDIVRLSRARVVDICEY